jgi:Flp pilus assembly CpaE family ATPase
MDATLLQFVLSESDFILLLGNPDVPSIKGLVSLVKKLNSLHFDPKKIKVIINRDNSKNQIDSKEFEKITRHAVTTYIPNNYGLCIEAVNKGEVVFDLNDKSDLSKKILELSQMVHTDFASTKDASTDAGGLIQMAKKGILRCF